MTPGPDTLNLPVLWVVTDQFPYPARNGITLPIFHYLKELGSTHSIRLILLVAHNAAINPSSLADNEALFGEIVQLRLDRKKAVIRAFNELFCQEMYQHGWTVNRPVHLAHLPAPQAVLVSPMSAVAKWRACDGPLLHPGVNHLAAVNDCTTAEYYFRSQSLGGNQTQRIKHRIDRMRSHWIGVIEKKLLQPYPFICLQTQTDRDLMRRLVGPETADKVVLVPNGVAQSYLSVMPTPGNQVVFVGELSGEYANSVHWLVAEVWPQIVIANKSVELLIVGMGASAKLSHLMRTTERVTHLEYVADLAAVYANAMVALSPVFKGFGLINKTLEAMACGLPVVGGLAAFNGLEGFQTNQHGVVCNERSSTEFVNVLSALISDPDRRSTIGINARALIATKFKWADTVQRIRKCLKSEETVDA